MKSFEVADLAAAQNFFKKYGFVVFQDVLSPAECTFLRPFKNILTIDVMDFFSGYPGFLEVTKAKPLWQRFGLHWKSAQKDFSVIRWKLGPCCLRNVMDCQKNRPQVEGLADGLEYVHFFFPLEILAKRLEFTVFMNFHEDISLTVGKKHSLFFL